MRLVGKYEHMMIGFSATVASPSLVDLGYAVKGLAKGNRLIHNHSDLVLHISNTGSQKAETQ